MLPIEARSWRSGASSRTVAGMLAVVERALGTRGFTVQPRRWVVARSFAWLLRRRRLARDDARRVQTSETLIEVAMMRLLIARLGQQS